jgi:tetratricopeptide (TPR) repeat protein
LPADNPEGSRPDAGRPLPAAKSQKKEETMNRSLAPRLTPPGLLHAACALALVWGMSCAVPPARSTAPRTKLVDEGAIALCMSRTAPSSRRSVTSRQRVPVEVFIDPALADLRSVKQVTIWKQGADGLTWEPLGSGPAGSPILIEPGEGLHGLRASALLADGSERLVPLPVDEPVLWVRVDAQPPSLVWIAPPANLSLRGIDAIDLEWAANEAEFGTAPCRLEWSEDGGSTWIEIAAVPARAGHQKYRWRVPPMRGGDGVLVRVACADLTGKEAGSTLALLYPRLDGDGPALVSAEPAGATGAAVPGAAPEQEPVVAVAPAVAGEGEAALVVTSAGMESESGTGTGTAAGTGTGTASGSGSGSGSASASESESESGAVAAAVAAADAGAAAGTGTGTGTGTGAAPGHRLEMHGFEREFLRGGETVEVSFACVPPLPTPLEARGTLEWSAGGDAGWTVAAEDVCLADGKAAWTVPPRSGRGWVLRLRADVGGTPLTGATSPPFAVDADAPRASLAELPAVLGARPRLVADVEDTGGSGVSRVQVLVRQPGGAWRAVPHEVAEKGLEIDLSAAPEADHEVFVQAVDGAGNQSPAPPAGEAVAAGARAFRLDRTPPLLIARAGPLAWVAGFGGEARVEAGWSDAVPPLVIEARAVDGSWVETGRWASLAPGQERFEFEVPVGGREHAVRFSLADAAGNRAYAIVGPRPVESSIRLASFTDGQTYAARGAEKIRWNLHPIAAERAADLRVTVLHLPRPGGEWTALYEDLPAAGECYWELPSGDAEEHRLLVRLLRGGKVAGEDLSPPFGIGGAVGPEPTVVRIRDESLYYSNAARSGMDRYLAAARGGAAAASSAELSILEREVVQNFKKALEIDARNYHATYGLAQFLNRLDPEKNASAVAEFLERTVAIKPDHFWALNDLGAMRIHGGDFARAEEALERSAAIEATPIVLYNLGLALFYGGKPGQARGRFEQALRGGGGKDVPEGEVYYYLVYSYLKDGDGGRARALFEEKEKLIPPDLRAGLEKALGG